MKHYIHVLKQYAVFEGRSRRSEYWWFVLIHMLILILITCVDIYAFGGGQGTPIGTAVGIIYSLTVFLPSLGVLVRRLHDTGRSGTWFFISFIPIIGGLILLVLTIQGSEPKTNRYGRNPKTG